MLDFLRLDLDLTGRGPGFSLVMDEQFDIVRSLLPGRGDVRGRIVLDQGQVGADTHVAIRLPIEVRTDAGDQRHDDAQLVLQAEGEDLAVDLVLPPLPGLVESAEAHLRLSSRTLPLPPWDDQWQRLGGVIDLHARFGSLALVQHLLVRLEGIQIEGHGDVRGHVVLEEGQLATGTEVTVSPASRRNAEHRSEGELGRLRYRGTWPNRRGSWFRQRSRAGYAGRRQSLGVARPTQSASAFLPCRFA